VVKQKVAADRDREEEKKETDEDGWTTEQQRQMEAGMKSVDPKMPTKERWVAIAELVEGKTPKECFERYKSIVAKLKSK
jgi:hypothetical protein